MKRIEIYTKDWCGFSARAKALLDAKGLDYLEIDVTEDTVRERAMIARSGRRTVPQVFIGGEPLGGSDDLARLEATGAFDRILGGDLSRRRPARPATRRAYDIGKTINTTPTVTEESKAILLGQGADKIAA